MLVTLLGNEFPNETVLARRMQERVCVHNKEVEDKHSRQLCNPYHRKQVS